MKVLCLLLVLTAGCATSVWAAEISQGLAPGKNSPETARTKKVPFSPFAPQESGALVEIYHKGWLAVSPLAPGSSGIGQRFLVTNPVTATGTSDVSNEKRREFGGIKLFGFDF